MRLLATLLACAMMAASAPSARAQTPAKVVAPEDRKAAIELFKQSRAAYQAGDFKQAALLLRRAYALDPAPTLLYNLARALESDGDLEGASDAYRQYIDADPTAKDRAAIEKRIANLDAQLRARKELEDRLAREEARKKAEETAAAKVVTPAPEPSSPSAVPWIVAGTGAASVVVGAVLGGLAQGKHADAESAASMADAVTLDDEARGLARGANIAYGVGAGLAAVGLVWGLVDVIGRDDGDEEVFEDEVRIRPVVGPQGVGVVGRF